MEKELWTVQFKFRGEGYRPNVYFWFQPKVKGDRPLQKTILRVFNINHGDPVMRVYKVDTIRND